MTRFLLTLLIAGFAALGSVPASAGDAPALFTMRAVPLESDPPDNIRSAPGGGRTLAPALLYTPASGDNPHGPALLILDEGPGSHPLARSQASRFAAERLAAAGYTVLAPYTGQERNFPTVPFADNRWAVKNAIDFLERLGHEDIAIIAQGYGALVAADYLKSTPDLSLDNGPERRVKGLVMINPALEPGGYPNAGDPRTIAEREALAKRLVADGTGLYPSAIEPGHNVAKAQADWILQGAYSMPAQGWLDYWSSAARSRNAALPIGLPVPTLVIAGARSPMAPPETVARLAAAGIETTIIAGVGNDPSPRSDAIVSDISGWLGRNGLGVRPRIRIAAIDITLPGGRSLYGLLYEPDGPADHRRPTVVLVSGRTGDALESSTHWMGWRIAQKGYRVIAPSFRISGVTGIQTETMAHLREDLGVWLDKAAGQQGRVVLAGHSNGGIWISDYAAVTRDRRVAGMVYFAPTVDAAPYKRKQIGDAEYERIDALAYDALRKGDRERMFGLESAVAFTELYGSRADTVHSERVKALKLPALAIIGGKDPLMSDWFISAFTANYGGPLKVVRYEGGSHGFRESKDRLAADVDSWLSATFH